MAAQRSQQLATRAGRQPLRPRSGCRYGNLRAPVQSGDANTDYNAAIALVQDKSRQMMRLWRFRTSSRNTLILLISRTPIIGWAS